MIIIARSNVSSAFNGPDFRYIIILVKCLALWVSGSNPTHLKADRRYIHVSTRLALFLFLCHTVELVNVCAGAGDFSRELLCKLLDPILSTLNPQKQYSMSCDRKYSIAGSLQPTDD